MMMNTAPRPKVTEPRQLRTALPEAEQIRAFLQCGALMAWSDDCWVIAWGEAERSAQPDAGRPSFYAPDFFLLEEKPWRIYPESAVVAPDALAQLLSPCGIKRRWENFDDAKFSAAFVKVMDALRDGSLRKAVPAVFETSPGALSASERERALRAAANLPSGLMPYGWWDDSGGVIGASPELLFEDDGVEIHTVAVAGTSRSGASPEEMMDDPKERGEHKLVLDDVASRLASLGHVTKGATRPWRIGMLSHLRTDLRVSPANPTGFAELVERLHPTPAVGIAPRGDWRAVIREIDGAPRGFLGAPFGLVMPQGRARCVVAIRGLQWDRQITRCGAGCGIVPGSRLERELAELRLKIAATRENLGL